jgi:hypothetical protein
LVQKANFAKLKEDLWHIGTIFMAALAALCHLRDPIQVEAGGGRALMGFNIQATIGDAKTQSNVSEWQQHALIDLSEPFSCREAAPLDQRSARFKQVHAFEGYQCQ